MVFSFWFLLAWFKVTKWIFDLEHLQSLIECVETLKSFAYSQTHSSIEEFLKLANQVIQHGSHFSKYEVYRLRSLLEDISADPYIRKLLGRNEPLLGGGTFFEAWSSAKMFAFVSHLLSYKNNPEKRRCHFEFDFDRMDMGITADDVRHHGRNCGAIYRQHMHDAVDLGEVDYGHIESVKSAALQTPRGTPRRTSIETPKATPRGTQREPPMETQRELSREPPMESPRQTPRLSRLEPSAAPGDVYFVIQTFLSEHLLNFLLSAHSITGLDRSGPIWDLYSHLYGYTRNPYCVGYVIYRPNLQATFFETLAGSELVRSALKIHLSKNFSDRSLATLRLQTKEEQECFFSILKTMVLNIAEVFCGQKDDDVLLYDCPQGGFCIFSPISLEVTFMKPSKRAQPQPYTIGQGVQSV